MNGITDKMRNSLENAGFEVKIPQNGVVISKGENVMLEIYQWHRRIIVRKQGKTEKYDNFKGVWARYGKIWLNVIQDNKFFSIKI